MSLQITQQISLEPYNTFGMMVKGLQLTPITSLTQLQEVQIMNKSNPLPYFILGGGSNMLLLNDVQAWILKNECKGIQLLKEDEHNVWLQVGGGEVWHDFVMHCVDLNYGGIENLALIPGTVGAAPIQNIGAYGVEVKDLIVEVKAFDLEDGTTKVFQNEDCEFAYRESIFKRLYKNILFIYEVTFKLNKQPTLQISYGDISQTLSKLELVPSVQNIAKAVIHIRQSKLPDPKVIGNSGSFFKNPEITLEQYNALKEQFPAIPGYVINASTIKVPAGWLIDQAGWKGYKKDNYGVHPKQALVLVNYGGATGQEIFELSKSIIADIHNKYGILLEREVQVYSF